MGIIAPAAAGFGINDETLLRGSYLRGLELLNALGKTVLGEFEGDLGGINGGFVLGDFALTLFFDAVEFGDRFLFIGNEFSVFLLKVKSLEHLVGAFGSFEFLRLKADVQLVTIDLGFGFVSFVGEFDRPLVSLLGELECFLGGVDFELGFTDLVKPFELLEPF